VTVALPARAKLNLDLQVIGRRADGLHELRTHMQAVELHDLLEASRADQTSLAITGLKVSGGRDNAVLRALSALESAAGRSLPTAFTLHKRIPPGSGLGGASSDAAAALRAASAVHALSVDLKPIAAEVGADVSFFLTGGRALVEGAGERVTQEPIEPRWFALAWPGIELSTPAVYEAWDRSGGDGPNHLRRAAGRVDPSINEFEAALGKGWRMTGSGSAFFLACSDRDGAVAAASRLECWTAVTPALESWG
jgi:4-diphosphocytidyl-2-C-methyl-D-erythritol kinase